MIDVARLGAWIEEEAARLDVALRAAGAAPRAVKRAARLALMRAWQAGEDGSGPPMAAALHDLLRARRRLPPRHASGWHEMRVRRPVLSAIRWPAPATQREVWLAAFERRWTPVEACDARRLAWLEARIAERAPTLVKPVSGPREAGGAHLAGELELIRKRGGSRKR